MADKIFCGSGKKKEFDNGGSITSITIDVGLLEQLYDEYGFTTNSGKRTMMLKVCSKREVDSYGNTPSVEIDTWKPDNAGNNNYNNQSGSRHVNNYNPDKDPKNNNSNSKFGSFPGGNSGGSNFEDDIPF